VFSKMDGGRDTQLCSINAISTTVCLSDYACSTVFHLPALQMKVSQAHVTANHGKHTIMMVTSGFSTGSRLFVRLTLNPCPAADIP
jgi:hypothetical protein